MTKAMFHVHYAIWTMVAISCVFTGMLFRGQQDIIEKRATERGESLILKDLSVAQLSNLPIR